MSQAGSRESSAHAVVDRDNGRDVSRARLPHWRSVATRLDLLASTGARHAARRFRRDRAFAAVAAIRLRELMRELWLDAAEEIGASLVEIEDGFEIHRGGSAAVVKGQRTELNSAASVERARHKPTAYGILTSAGLPVPEHRTFRPRELRRAQEFLAAGRIPCVVKPASGSGGDGVTGAIRNPRDLRRGALSASRFARELLIERQVPGEVFRLLVLDGVVLDVLHRLRPSVTGDGHSTVEELIFAEDDHRLRANGRAGLKPFAVDLDCLLCLRQAGLSLRSVPAAGATVIVKTVTNFNRPDDNFSLGTAISEDLYADAVAAATAVGLRLVGIDVVAPTAHAALAASGGVIIDVNAIPALHHHSLVADPETAVSVAVPVLSALLSRGTPPRTPRLPPCHP
jgi:cyanophycin synthetase